MWISSKGTYNKASLQMVLMVNKLMVNNLYPEAVAQWCSVKKVLLKISQFSQGKNCAKASFFNKVAA